VADERVQIEIGFAGSQIMLARVTAESAEALERALRAGSDGVTELDAEDGSYLVVLPKVVYVKRLARESRVGFGTD
jgi:hypothetical protein